MSELPSLQWIKMPTNAQNDPKVFALAKDFNCHQMTAFGYITVLALVTASNAPSGELTQYSDAALAGFCGISGKKKVEKFITSLKKCGIIFEKTEKNSEENSEENKNFQKKVYFYDHENIRKASVKLAETRVRECEKKRKQRGKQNAEANDETEDVPQGQVEYVPGGIPGKDNIRKNNINSIIYPISSNQSLKRYDMDEIDALIKHNIDFDILRTEYTEGELENLVELIVEVIYSNAPTIKIAGSDTPREHVRERFFRLDIEHIRYVLECFSKNSTKVRNIKAYLITSLYNAPATMSSYYTAAVNHDMTESQ